MPVVPQNPQAAPPKPGIEIRQPVTIRGERGITDLETGKTTYDGNVTVIYEPTQIRADHVEYWEKERRGVAEGNVLLTDPEGTIKARRIALNWTDNSAEAEDVEARVGGFYLKARSASLPARRPDGTTVWTFEGVEFTNCQRDEPSYLVQAEKLVVTLGKGATATKVTLMLLGKKVGTLPRYTFSLDRMNKGIGFPVITRSRDGKFGATWDSGLLLGKNFALDYSLNVFQKRYPTGRLSLTRSFLKGSSGFPIAPIDEFGERFAYGYLEGVRIPSLDWEESLFRAKRNAVAVATTWNSTPVTRRENQLFNKPVELAYELGTSLGRGWNGLFLLKAESIEPVGGDAQTRGTLAAGFMSPRFKLGPKVFGLARVETEQFVGKTTYGWARGSMTLLYQANDNLRFGLGYVNSLDYGTPQFVIDPLAFGHSLHARMDAELGPRRLSVLFKYDMDRRRRFDFEFRFSQVIGCLDIFVQNRDFPRSFQIGVRLRGQDFIERLRGRTVKREKDYAGTGGK
jgi:hypothetical protein